MSTLTWEYFDSKSNKVLDKITLFHPIEQIGETHRQQNRDQDREQGREQGVK
jgi:hypothetical protein